MTTVTIWIPESDLENLQTLEERLPKYSSKEHIEWCNNQTPLTFYTEKRHIELLQVNVSLDLFVKINMK